MEFSGLDLRGNVHPPRCPLATGPHRHRAPVNPHVAGEIDLLVAALAPKAEHPAPFALCHSLWCTVHYVVHLI